MSEINEKTTALTRIIWTAHIALPIMWLGLDIAWAEVVWVWLVITMLGITIIGVIARNYYLRWAASNGEQPDISFAPATPIDFLFHLAFTLVETYLMLFCAHHPLLAAMLVATQTILLFE